MSHAQYYFSCFDFERETLVHVKYFFLNHRLWSFDLDNFWKIFLLIFCMNSAWADRLSYFISSKELYAWNEIFSKRVSKIQHLYPSKILHSISSTFKLIKILKIKEKEYPIFILLSFFSSSIQVLYFGSAYTLEKLNNK